MGLLGRLPSRPAGDGAGSAPQAPAPAPPVAPPPAYQPPTERAAPIAVAEPPAPPLAPASERLRQIRRAVVERVEAALEGKEPYIDKSPEMQARVQEEFEQAFLEIAPDLSPAEKERLRRDVTDEVAGYGPIQPLLEEDTVSEVMVNGPHLVYAEQKGRLHETDARFDDDEHVMKIIRHILDPLGRRVDRKWPIADARLPDGSRVNVIIPPSALNGPTVTIRKFSKKPLTVADLIRFGSMTDQMAQFLKMCVEARLNVVVAGGTGSGKTTLLNVLSGFIPDDERIVTIEDSAELQLRQRHVVTLEAKPPDPDGTGSVTIRDLVRNSLRMRPERIVVGECRGGEALDMLQAMNTGHDGSLTTLHANTPRDAIARMETMSLMSGLDLPVRTIREQIASAIDLIVQQARLRDGARKVVAITEVQGMEGEVITLQDVFMFKEYAQDETGKVLGEMVPTGIRPKFYYKFEEKGFYLPPETFDPRAAMAAGRR
jgi:pilus assembly protein CpaF